MTSNSHPDTRITLIARIRDVGDDDAWSEFVQIYQPVVQRFAQRYGLQYADAAEVTQEVLSGVARSIESWDPNRERGTFRGWLYRITRNKTIDFMRKHKAEQSRKAEPGHGLSQFAESVESESAEFQAEFEKQIFLWAAEKLRPSVKPTNWQAFWLSAVEGHSIESVARQLNVECGTVYVARSRIMARLSGLIQNRLNETHESFQVEGEK